MRRKGIFTLLTSVFMVLAFSAVTFAANKVVMKTTTPNIPKSTCYQAGTDSLEFDTLTNIADGDIIQLTLSNTVPVCKPINLWLKIATGMVLDPSTDATAPVSTTGGAISAPDGGNDWGFLIKATAGSQVITLTLRQRLTAAPNTLVTPTAMHMLFTGSAPANVFTVKLFDGKWTSTNSGFYAQTAVTGAYDIPLTSTTGPTTNILCIDTLTHDYPFADVENTYDSIPINVADKLNFSGDFRVAHILSTLSYNLATCKGMVTGCGNIALGAITSSQAATCVAFDYETVGTGSSTTVGNGYCTNHTAASGYLPKFILQSSVPFDPTALVPYTVTAEILVNGATGEHGVYWSNTTPKYQTSATTTCGTPVATGTFAGVAYLRGDGVTVPVPAAPISGNCAGVAAGAKAVKFTTTAGVLFAAGDYFFELNLPPFNYNLAEINVGDAVSVRVTLSKGTCGTVTTGTSTLPDLCIGTFGCAAGPVGPGAFRLCPYVTSLAAGDTYWDGIAIVNTGAAAGTVDLTAFKNNGTTSTFTTPSIAAGGMYVKLLSGIPWVGTAPVGVPAYITLQASSTIPAGSLDAFVMMADGANNSMGYLCRP
jgi:hypothetical protein